MSAIQSPSQERLHTAWFGARGAAQVPMHPGGSDSVTSPHADTAARQSASRRSTSRRWPHRVMRMVRDVAIGLALITAVPVVTVLRIGQRPVPYNTESTRVRLESANQWRSLMIAPDASISPMQAGTALRSLMTGPEKEHFPMHGAALSVERVWQTRTLDADMFPNIRLPNSTLPSALGIVSFAPGGFSERELAYLRDVATSPVWDAFDLVARAPNIDMIGGRFVVPFAPDANALGMPIMRFADTKAMAQAGVSRAAYYVAIGEPARAEAALRSIVSFGFGLIDNGTSGIDALIGRVIVDIGRNGLQQFYAVTGNRDMEMVAFPPVNASSGPPATASPTSTVANLNALQALLVADVRNEHLPRSLRFESLRGLAFTSCGTVGGMLSGPPSDVQAAFAYARQSLARYPSEQAYIDLLLDTPNRISASELGWQRSVPNSIISGSSIVAATVLQNPRVEVCPRVTGMF